MLPFSYLIMGGNEAVQIPAKKHFSVFQCEIFLLIIGLQRFQRCQLLVLIQEREAFQALHNIFEGGKPLSALIDSFYGTGSIQRFSLTTVNGCNFCLSNMKKSEGVWYLSLTSHPLLQECRKGAYFPKNNLSH